MNKEIISIEDGFVSAEDLYGFLFDSTEKKESYPFRKWIANRINDYGFVKDEDFRKTFSESTGGRPKAVYAISIDMAKELSMVEKTKRGKQARKYFIKCEKIAKKAYRQRVVAIEARKTVTDKIKDSGENERMHGHGYSQYTMLAYSLCGITRPRGAKDFRDTLTEDQLKRVSTVETMIGSMLDLGNEYKEIKDQLSPIFNKAIK